MGGFLEGLTAILGGPAAVGQIDKNGFDWREKLDQAQWTRDRTKQLASQQDEDRALAQTADYLTSAEEPNPEDMSALLPRVDAARKRALVAVATGKAAQSKSALQQQKAYSDVALQRLKGDQASSLEDQRTQAKMDLLDKAEAIRRDQTASPREKELALQRIQAQLDLFYRAEAGRNARASMMVGARTPIKVPGQNEAGEAGTYLIPPGGGGQPQFIPAGPTAQTRGQQYGRRMAQNALDNLMKTYESMGGQPEGGLEARGTGLVRRGASALGYAPEVNTYSKGVRGFVPLLARALGHVGVLTELDVQRTEELLPRPGDTAEEARQKRQLWADIMSGQAQLPFQFGQGGGKPIAYIDDNGDTQSWGGGQRMPNGGGHGPAVQRRRLPNGSMQYRDAQGNVW
jgi:hypothetical protein